MRKAVVRGGILLLSTALSLIFLEVGSRLVFRAGREGLAPTEMFLRELNRFEYREFFRLRENGCSNDDIYVPHPLFDSVYRPSGPCALPGVNRLGFRSREYPLAPEQGKFRILVLGASVADLLASYSPNSFLENAFRELARGPRGEDIEVYSGAVGGWRLPNQEIAFNRFITQFDAVIALDGHNEFFLLDSPGGILAPNTFFLAPHVRYDSWLWGPLHQLYRLVEPWRWRFGFRNSVAFQALVHVWRRSLEGHFLEASRASEALVMANVYGYPTGEAELPEEARSQDLVTRFAKYSKMLHATSKAIGKRSLHVLQPVAFVGKTLVDSETELRDESSGKRYRAFVDDVLAETRGEATYSLLDIFADDSDRAVYLDRVHFKEDEAGHYGHKKAARAIVELAIRQWRLRPPKPETSP